MEKYGFFCELIIWIFAVYVPSSSCAWPNEDYLPSLHNIMWTNGFLLGFVIGLITLVMYMIWRTERGNGQNVNQQPVIELEPAVVLEDVQYEEGGMLTKRYVYAKRVVLRCKEAIPEVLQLLYNPNKRKLEAIGHK